MKNKTIIIQKMYYYVQIKIDIHAESSMPVWNQFHQLVSWTILLSVQTFRTSSSQAVGNIARLRGTCSLIIFSLN